MRRDSQGDAGLRLAVLGLGAQLLLIAACTADDAPPWSRASLDAGTTGPFRDDPTAEQDAGMGLGPDVEPKCGEEQQGFHLDGDNNGPEPWDDFDMVYSARLRLAQGDSSFEATTLPEGDGIEVDIVSDTGKQIWHATFRTAISGQQLERGVYQVDQRFGSEPGPSMEINGFAENYPAQIRDCGFVCGSFEVHEIQVSGPTVERFVATFKQHCRCARAALRGCASFSP